jgi:hypothetical protein
MEPGDPADYSSSGKVIDDAIVAMTRAIETGRSMGYPS